MTPFLPPLGLTCYRLFLVLVLTVFRMAGVIAASLVRGWSGTRVAGQASQWAEALVSRLDIDIVLEGRLPNRGVLVVSNHRSYLDIVVILSHIESTFLAKAELRKWPVFGYAAMKGNTVFVDRADPKSREISRRQLAERLDQGISVVVFPEGTTHEGPGLLEFKKGIFHMAAKKGIPVVPVAILYENRAAAWVGEDSFIPHFLKIFKNRRLKTHMTVGPVLKEDNAEDLKAACHGFIDQALASKEDKKGKPADPTKACIISGQTLTS
ncbi:lysophospholipid acyltransferase family protein [Desulfospira joergensenii]|uniref:lysophospholipid acyltransferase family protein n=1 Tax=Desulfospira joergensenii TaxID=53329 RepID=UPI0004806EE3|nr:lysophospholipid acyltransferase family protein [Desulfospira joergensenii]